MKFYGNVVAPEAAGYGYIDIADGRITDVVIEEQCRKDAEWILPGFIDSHLHGLLAGAAIAEKVHLMAELAPSTGLVRFCPTMASDTHEKLLAFVERVRDIFNVPSEVFKNSAVS